jgi:adenine-specific DNA-methyltransferase
MSEIQMPYSQKQSREEMIKDLPHIQLLDEHQYPSSGAYSKITNLLIHGDNALVLRHLIDVCNLRGAVDLVYIDPPFATNNIFTVSHGRASTISASADGEIAYHDDFSLEEFLDFLRLRLYLLHDLLSDQGSIYVHTDYKIGHYVKVLMDEIFGRENFRNDITRIKCNPKNFPRKGYSNYKDLILFYSKSENMIWHEPKQPFTETEIEKLYPKTDIHGRRYTSVPLHAPGETKQGASSQEFRGMKPPVGRHWRTDVATLESWDKAGLIEWSSKGNPRKIIFADEQIGKRMQDIWEFKDPQYPVYPTEKPPALLETIIQTSSNPDSTVLDCFCGSGTTLQQASLLGRKWIGIDASAVALQAVQEKLRARAQGLFNTHEYSMLHAKLVLDNHEVSA